MNFASTSFVFCRQLVFIAGYASKFLHVAIRFNQFAVKLLLVNVGEQRNLVGVISHFSLNWRYFSTYTGFLKTPSFVDHGRIQWLFKNFLNIFFLHCRLF